jgi:hypothetical protein
MKMDSNNYDPKFTDKFLEAAKLFVEKARPDK